MVKKRLVFYMVAFLLLAALGIQQYKKTDKEPKNILFVTSVALSGPAKHLGIEYSNGINAYFKHANEQNMLGKDRVSLDVYDDQYEPFLTQTNIKEAIKKQNIYGVLGVVGTPTAEEAMRVALNADIPFLMPLTGAKFLYGDNPLIFTLRPSYELEAAEMARYMLAHDIKRVAVVYQNDSFGINALNALTSSIGKSGIKLVAEGVYNRNTLSINYALSEIIRYAPQAVVVAGTHKPTVELIKKAEEKNLHTLFFNFSFGGYEPIYEESRKKNVNLQSIFVTQVMPPLYLDSADSGEFKKIYAKYYPSHKPNSIAFEGYLAAKTVVAALKQGRGSKSDFVKSLSSLELELAGKKLQYAKKRHDGLKSVYLIRFGDNGGVLVND